MAGIVATLEKLQLLAEASEEMKGRSDAYDYGVKPGPTEDARARAGSADAGARLGDEAGADEHGYGG